MTCPPHHPAADTNVNKRAQIGTPHFQASSLGLTGYGIFVLTIDGEIRLAIPMLLTKLASRVYNQMLKRLQQKCVGVSAKIQRFKWLPGDAKCQMATQSSMWRPRVPNGDAKLHVETQSANWRCGVTPGDATRPLEILDLYFAGLCRWHLQTGPVFNQTGT